ncbi:MAG: hypothetical protein KIT83_01950 [Bryobacterales bacterium]|nr:hypothetical protein [Bryobacterales bacterium]
MQIRTQSSARRTSDTRLGEAAQVLGRFTLGRTEARGGPASGRFAVVLRKTAGAWAIIHDQTGAD